MSNYCPRIFHGLTLSQISNSGLAYAQCCWTKNTIATDDIIDINHLKLQDLRQQNLMDQLPWNHCQDCLLQERQGKKSMRQGYLETHGGPTYDTTIQYLDINIDYTCNLACVTCGPDLSTTWRNELKLPGHSVRPKLNNFLSQLDQLDLSHLKEIRFWGGEPLLTKTHEHILAYITEKFDPTKIKLMYNTNATRIIDDATKTLIEKFKFARISFSVDAIGSKFHYIRYPAKWNEVEENLQWWKNNLPHNSMLALTVTASIFNVLYLDEVFDWKQKHFDKSRFGDDIEIYVHHAFGWSGLENMTADMANTVRTLENYCQPWIQKLDILASNDSGSKIFQNKISEIDNRRQLWLDRELPEVATLMGYHR